MAFMGKIEMKNPEIILGCFEECELICSAHSPPNSQRLLDPDKHGYTRSKHEGDGQFIEVFFGRLVCFPTVHRNMEC